MLGQVSHLLVFLGINIYLYKIVPPVLIGSEREDIIC